MTPPSSRSESIVVALGGNAVAPQGERPTIANQFRHTRASLAPIVDLARAGWNIVLVHGNGPQVGDELARNEIAADQVEPLPLGVLVAGTAGWMGYMIQQSLQNALARAGVQRTVVTLITQTLCDADDPNLRTPSKPIGHALDAARMARLQARGVPVREEKPGQWRRLAPSPRPIGIVERDMVRQLVGAGHIVIACGGGGPPVFQEARLGLEGIDAAFMISALTRASSYGSDLFAFKDASYEQIAFFPETFDVDIHIVNPLLLRSLVRPRNP